MTKRQLRTTRNTVNLNPNLWDKQKFRNLTHTAQWLWLTLHTLPELSQAGTLDYHPARIAAHTTNLTTQDIHNAADELQTAGYILVDHNTMELAITDYSTRNRWLHAPSAGISVGTAAQKIASPKIRQHLINEFTALRQQQPHNSALHAQPITDMLTH